MGYLNTIPARIQNIWFTARDREHGQTLIEYVLIITLISVAAIVALGFLGGTISEFFSDAGTSIEDAG